MPFGAAFLPSLPSQVMVLRPSCAATRTTSTVLPPCLTLRTSFAARPRAKPTATFAPGLAVSLEWLRVRMSFEVVETVA